MIIHNIFAGRPTLVCPYVGVHRRMSLIISSLLPQQCPTCLIRLKLMDYGMGNKKLYNCCFVRCCFQDLFKIARSILIYLSSSHKKDFKNGTPCLTLSIIRYVSRVKWSDPGNGVAPFLHISVVAIERGAF